MATLVQNGTAESSDDVCALHRLLSMPLSPVVTLQHTMFMLILCAQTVLTNISKIFHCIQNLMNVTESTIQNEKHAYMYKYITGLHNSKKWCIIIAKLESLFCTVFFWFKK